MKKFILPLIVTFVCLGYYSCSPENEVILEDSQSHSAYRIKESSDVDNAKKLYAEMMESNEYKDFKESVKAFNTKLNNHDVSFSTKEEWIDWIKDKISTTKFTDEKEFETIYDEMVSKCAKMMIRHENLFNSLEGADKEQISKIIEPELDSPEYSPGYTTQSDCADDCIDQYEGSIDIGLNIYVYGGIEDAMNTQKYPDGFRKATMRIVSSFQAFANWANWRLGVLGACVQDCMNNEG